MKKSKASTNLFLAAVGPLLGDHAYPLVPEYPDAEDGYSAAIDELHGLDREDRGDDVVGVVLAPGHGHEAVPRAADEDEIAGPEEAEQPRTGVLDVAEGLALGLQRLDLEVVVGQALEAPVLAARRRAVHADLPDLVRLADQRRALHLYHRHDAWCEN